MKKYFILFILFILFTTQFFAQQIKTSDWITDLNFLKSELEKKHPDLYFKFSEQDFDSELNKIIKNLESDSDRITSLKVTQLLSNIGDSHTGVSRNNYIKNKVKIPFYFEYFKDGFYIIGTTKNNRRFLDRKITSINNFPMEQIIDSLKTLFVAENKGMINKNVPRLLTNKYILDYFKFSKSEDKLLDIGIVNDEKIEEIMQVKLEDYSIKKNRIRTNFESKTPYYIYKQKMWFKARYFESDKIYYVQYNRCMSKETVLKYGNKEEAHKYPSFKEFENEILTKLLTKDIDKIIFDMRFNQGGSSFLAESLIDEIAKNKKLNTKENLFVVVGKKTYSSAIFNTIYFKENTNATIIGEETSGKPNHYGNVKNFYLPYSNLKITFSNNFYKLIETNDNSIIPDQIIEGTFADFKKGIDPVFEWVKNQ